MFYDNREDAHYELMADFDYRNEAFSDPDYYADEEDAVEAQREAALADAEYARGLAATAGMDDIEF